MAAGEGRRLRPLTESWPKPVLPIDGRPVAAELIARAYGGRPAGFVAHEPVGLGQRGTVERTRPRYSEVGVPRPARVLDEGERAGADHDQTGTCPGRHGSTATKRTPTPGVTRAGSGREGSHMTASV